MSMVSKLDDVIESMMAFKNAYLDLLDEEEFKSSSSSSTIPDAQRAKLRTALRTKPINGDRVMIDNPYSLFYQHTGEVVGTNGGSVMIKVDGYENRQSLETIAAVTVLRGK